LRYEVGLIRERHLVSNLWNHDIPRPPEVRDHGHRAAGEGFKNNARSVLADRGKHHHISRAHTVEDFRVAEPAAEGNSFFDAKGFCELLETVAFRAITDHGETGQTALQKWSSRAQSKIATLSGDQASNKNQLQYFARLRNARVAGTQRKINSWLRDKKQFVAILGKFGIPLRRSDYDRRRVAIGGPGKRQKPV